MASYRLFFAPLVFVSGLLTFGCSGGGGSVSSGAAATQNTPPQVSGFSYSPGDAQLNPYSTYSFTAAGSDPDIGDVIASYTWDFGDGSSQVTTSSATTIHGFNKGTLDPAKGGSVSVRVLATDSRGASSGWYSKTLTVAGQPSPVTVSFVSPTQPVILQASTTGSVSQAFQIQTTDATGGTISASGIALTTGDTATGAQVVGTVSNGGGLFTITVNYQPGTIGSSRTDTPSVVVTNSNGLSSATVTGPAVTITTTGPNNPPSVVVTQPASPTTPIYSSVKATLAFTLTDSDGDPVAYSVDWGDGTQPTTATVASGTAAGAAVTLTHAYADTFTATTANANVVITAQDNRGGTAPTQNRTFAVTYNTYPAAAILSPGPSGTLPSATELPSNPGTGLYNPATVTSPDLVVIPAGGSLIFSGTATPPASGGTLSYLWAFNGGVPATSTQSTPPRIVYPGVAGQTVAYLVTLTVTDSLNRSSNTGTPQNRTPPVAKTFQKWVVVDGAHTQNFNLSFLYRQRSQTGADVFTSATQASNGYGANVQVFQDGQFTTFSVSDLTSHATVQIPVRSNLPFYVQVPGFGSDTHGYLLQIPNAPTGPFADSSLGLTLGAGSSFGFQNTSAPWNPTLQVVTAEGFGPETTAVGQRRLQGLVNSSGPYGANLAGGAVPNVRWMDRLSVAGDDPTGAIQWIQNSNNMGSFSGIPANQLFDEWTLFAHTLQVDSSILAGVSTPKFNTAAASPTDLGFTLNYPKYSADSVLSDAYAINALQAFRVPASTTDPYDLNSGNNAFNDASLTVGLGAINAPVPPSTTPGFTPAKNGATVRAYLDQIANLAQGSVPLQGGITGFTIPYDGNDPNRIPNQALVGNFSGLKQVFSYADYLWSRVWARPYVLDCASLSYLDTMQNMGSFNGFSYGNPALTWPKSTNPISPDGSRIDLTANGYPAFDASQSPISTGGMPPSTGVGHFYWASSTPFYSAASGSVISRSWLADAMGQFPTTFNGVSATGFALSGWGFTPPIDLVVDKRGRDATGVLNGQSSGGYRIAWFNPTKDAGGHVVPPDFWVVDIQANGKTQDFMLPANYPATQAVSNPVLTDARTFLPSGASTYVGGDSVGPGYCWLDLPLELRPVSGTAIITVFAVKTVKTNTSATAAARPLNRPDWIEGVKTATPRVSIVSSTGDVSFGHKILFKYPWDIVIVNSAQTLVAP